MKFFTRFNINTIIFLSFQIIALNIPAGAADHKNNNHAGDSEKSSSQPLLKNLESEPINQVTDTKIEKLLKRRSLLAQKLQNENKLVENDYAITAYKPNYLLPLTYVTEFNTAPFESSQEIVGDPNELKNIEARFQFSIKLLLAKDLLFNNDSINFGFTSRSYWQLYAKNNSAPFRETVYEPELFWQSPFLVTLLPNQLNFFGLGFSHESNGRSGALSRSWNRIYTLLEWEQDQWLYQFKPWWRIPEAEKEQPSDSSGDDNPDIEKYLGHFEFRATRLWKDQEFSILIRNNLRTETRGAIQLDWIKPIGKKLNGIITLFNGYGENLIDYDQSVNSIGFGILLNGWT